MLFYNMREQASKVLRFSLNGVIEYVGICHPPKSFVIKGGILSMGNDGLEGRGQVGEISCWKKGGIKWNRYLRF